MTIRDYLHELVDRLAEEELIAALRSLEFIKSGYTDPLLWRLDNAPVDDEPTTLEDEASIAEARAETRRGDTISAEEAKRRLLSDIGA